MAENHTLRTDREKDAVNLNQTEERRLLKALNTLNLEKTYSLKMLNLEQKQVKYGQKRLRAKVKTIKTHLAPEDIASMKTMEIEGTFESEYTPINGSSVLRILAASKRLKIMTNEELEHLVERDLRRPLTTESTTVVPLSRPMTPAESLRMRSKSLPRDLNSSAETSFSQYETKKFPVMKRNSEDETMYDSLDNLYSASRLMVAPTGRIGETAKEIDKRLERPKTCHGARMYRDINSTKESNREQLVVTGHMKSAVQRPSSRQAHALTTRGFLSARPSTGNVQTIPPRTPRSARTVRPKTSLGIQRLNYSSHKLRVNTEDRCRRESVLSTSSIGSEIAREKAAEIRKELLNDEQTLSATIEDKRQTFLTRIQHWVTESANTARSRSQSPDKTTAVA